MTLLRHSRFCSHRSRASLEKHLRVRSRSHVPDLPARFIRVREVRSDRATDAAPVGGDPGEAVQTQSARRPGSDFVTESAVLRNDHVPGIRWPRVAMVTTTESSAARRTARGMRFMIYIHNHSRPRGRVRPERDRIRCRVVVFACGACRRINGNTF